MELLLVVALSAMIIGGVVVSYGTLSRSQPSVQAVVSVPLGTTRMLNFYNENSATSEVAMAPQYDALAKAEDLRVQFLTDTISATAVFCLPRDGINTWRPSYIPHDPEVDIELDTPQKFRSYIIDKLGVSPTLYRDYRNPLNDANSVPQNLSIFVMGYSKFEGYLKVNAIYDIDVIRFSAISEPNGYHASVKRYTDSSNSSTPTTLKYISGYEVFYPPSVPNATKESQWSTDGFAPLYVTFERASRLALRESTTIDRFKRAYERPFYMIWWPDPATRHLGAVANTFASSDPRQAYNHMAGRTSFMFVVPMFPAL